MRDYEKLDKFIRKMLEKDVYAEIPSEPHISITQQMVARLESLVGLAGKHVLDVGCGQGIALIEFTKFQANPIGITFGEDAKVCAALGLNVKEMDQSFLTFDQNSFDVIWCRHALEHSLFPLFTLNGFHQALKPNGVLYVEVPAPDTSARHETNPNHYSVFGAKAWQELFKKTGFYVFESHSLKMTLPCGPDEYFAFILKKLSD